MDSVAAPFRHGFADMAMRNRVLSGMAQNLIKLATECNIAVSYCITCEWCLLNVLIQVVLTNQMTTKPHPQSHTPSQLVPALGKVHRLWWVFCKVVNKGSVNLCENGFFCSLIWCLVFWCLHGFEGEKMPL